MFKKIIVFVLRDNLFLHLLSKVGLDRTLDSRIVQ